MDQCLALSSLTDSQKQVYRCIWGYHLELNMVRAVLLGGSAEQKCTNLEESHSEPHLAGDSHCGGQMESIRNDWVGGSLHLQTCSGEPLSKFSGHQSSDLLIHTENVESMWSCAEEKICHQRGKSKEPFLSCMEKVFLPTDDKQRDVLSRMILWNSKMYRVWQNTWCLQSVY